MVTIAHLVEKIVEKKPFLEEAVARGIINYAALADTLQPDIEKELKQKVKTSAIMMALRRLAEKLEKKLAVQIKFKDTDITIKSDLFETTVLKSPSVMSNIRKMYDLIDVSKGDFLTVTHGIYEITVISNKKYKDKIPKILASEKIIKTIDKLSSLTLKIPVEAVETPGFFYVVTKALNWENINIVEIVSTLTELTFIIKEDDTARAFETLKQLIDEQKD